jgi:hypothetical protein
LVEKTARGAVSSRQEQDLLVAATGYEQVLLSLATTGEQRAQHVGVLGQLLEGVTKASAAPPAVLLWLSAWQAELTRRVAVDACQGARECEQKIKPLALPTKAALDKQLGPQMAGLLRRGVLPVGGVELEFRYRAGRLAPQISVEPAFLLVHISQLDSSTKPSSVIKLEPPKPAAPSHGAGSHGAGSPEAAKHSAPQPTPATPSPPTPATPAPAAPKPNPASTTL